jgi:predicted ATPase
MPQPAEQLVGRAAELELLDRELAELERTGSRAIELAGEPGIGKTRLLAELGDRADRAGLLVLSGSASELERELPFWIFVDALDDYVHALEPRRLALLDDEVRAELGQILPSLEAGAGGAPMRPEPHRTQRAFRQLLDALAIDKPWCCCSTTCIGRTPPRSSCSARCCGGRRTARC